MTFKISLSGSSGIERMGTGRFQVILTVLYRYKYTFLIFWKSSRPKTPRNDIFDQIACNHKLVHPKEMF